MTSENDAIGLVSAVSKASSKHPTSLRTTIPEAICAFLGLGAGDKVEWRMEGDKPGGRYCIVRKAGDPVVGNVKRTEAAEKLPDIPSSSAAYHLDSYEGIVSMKGLMVQNHSPKGIVVSMCGSQSGIYVDIKEITEN